MTLIVLLIDEPVGQSSGYASKSANRKTRRSARNDHQLRACDSENRSRRDGQCLRADRGWNRVRAGYRWFARDLEWTDVRGPRFGRDVESTAVQTDAWHHRTDAMTSIAAFVGISVALIGRDRWQSADDWAALFACALIGANGYRLLKPALFEIMDTAPRGEIVDSVRNAAAAVPGVIEVEKCLIRKMG